jgi:uncharacterized protein YndB with AHSA1/START domain
MVKRNPEEVRISHMIRADRDEVFKAWINPALLVQWYAPEGCTIVYKHIDVRPGGTFHYCIRNPKYHDCWCIGTYLEISAPDKLVYTIETSDASGVPVDPKSSGMDPDWPAKTIVTVLFEDLGEKTRIILLQTVAQNLAKKTGAFPSWINMLNRLDKIITINKN